MPVIKNILRRCRRAGERFFPAIAVVFAIAMPISAFADEPKGFDYFKGGIELSREGKFEEAARNFASARTNLPILADYALFYEADSLFKAFKASESEKALSKLLKDYPSSPLVKDVYKLRIRNYMSIDSKKATALLQDYIKKYPGDREAEFTYAKLIMPAEPEKASAMLKKIYINAGEFSDKAGEEIPGYELTSGELHERAMNLLSRGRYDEAESFVIKAMTANGEDDKDLYEAYAHCLFGQKRYSEAYLFFSETPNLYYSASSLLRAQRMPEFREALKKLRASGDENAGKLMISDALEKRRSGDTKGALKVLAEIQKIYPSQSENAEWYTGWVYYMSRDYKRAAQAFGSLYDRFGQPKYIYWKARSIERMGWDASDMYLSLRTHAGYYGLLAGLRTGSGKGVNTIEKPAEIPVQSAATKRPALLYRLGLHSMALREFKILAAASADPSVLKETAYWLREMGEYGEAMNVAMKLPDGEKPVDILYPEAFWPTVKEVSDSFKMNPYVILSVMREESRYDPSAFSKAGAMGLMQLMPATARRLASGLDMKIEKNEHIYNVDVNIKLGSYYLSKLIGEFDSLPAALAAYNAGEGRVRNWLAGGKYSSSDEFIEDIPFIETREYVKRILSSYYRYENNPDSMRTAVKPF